MKVLTRDQIVEEYRFPLTEALAFAILVWTGWGLAEAFYWEKLTFLFGAGDRIHPLIYTEAFFTYIALAAAFALFFYAPLRLIMTRLPRFNPHTFRGLTLSFILISFFALALNYYLPHHLLKSGLSAGFIYTVVGFLVLFASVSSVLLFRSASGLNFRIRRSGTMMLSILVISLLLSFVRFPLFWPQTPDRTGDASEGFQKLMAYHYIKPLLSHPTQKYE